MSSKIDGYTSFGPCTLVSAHCLHLQNASLAEVSWLFGSSRASIMANLAPEVAVFTITNLATRFAMAVPRDITAGALKRELERVHFDCFPEFGEIHAYGLMVKRKSFFYHLPDTLLVKCALQGVKGAWFLHMKVKPLNELDKPCLGFTANEFEMKSEENNSRSMVEATSELSSEIISVPCIIRRYFPFLNEESSFSDLSESHVTSRDTIHHPKEQLKNKVSDNKKASPRFTFKRAFKRARSFAGRQTSEICHRDPKVGKRLVTASYNLGISPSKLRAEISLCSSLSRKSVRVLSPSLAKSSVFEISSRED